MHRTPAMQRHAMALVEKLLLMEVPIMRFLTHAAIVVSLACSPALAQAQQATQAAAPIEVDGFARAAAENNLSQVLLSSMALQRSNDKRVQDSAWTMLDHHSRAMGELAEALSEGAASLPTELSSEQSTSLQRLRELSGTQFDQAYFAYQLEAHQRAINLFERAGQVSDRKVAQYARVTLPVLRAHREIAQYRQGQPPQPMPAQ
ncbi:DUF4142 domain-containing protein [Belnapia sp. F-4-1]|uniref:DUF4142 domain-containing protein n=1 Tax=Belnapia sp. F-4-1 TaxID=1545443 RepID=UPI0005B8C70C|nr:DUF4142 domain-containing protein [Belnapia sp. F-4-1]